MPSLFETTRIHRLVLKNRFVRSATWEGLATVEGRVTPPLVEKMVELAQGGVGLIISGHAYVSEEGQAGVRQLGAHSDDLIPGLAQMTEAVHAAEGKIVLQLAHAGSQAAVRLTEKAAVGPSPCEVEPGAWAQEMSLEDIHRTAEAFGRGAARAVKAGFDGVQIHAAHGYLLSQFLSPHFNRRTDEYGGDIQNRNRVVLEVYDRIRDAVGPEFPVTIKMNSEDFLEDGLTVEEMLTTCACLEKSGIDAVELSGGTRFSGKNIPVRMQKIESADDEVYYREAARRFKKQVRVPLMLVGGIRTYETAERLVAEKTTDYVSLCRPLIREPQLIRRWESGNRAGSACRSDNLCFAPIREGGGMYCVVEARHRKKEG